jgi:hypothetical protein
MQLDVYAVMTARSDIAPLMITTPDCGHVYASLTITIINRDGGLSVPG